MNRIKVRAYIGGQDKLTLSHAEITALCKQFRKVRILRKFTQARVGEIYNVSFHIVSDWEHGFRITPYAESCLRDFIEGDTSAFTRFAEEFKSVHLMLIELLPRFYNKSPDRFDKREVFMDKLYDMKLAFYSLKDFDKINICKSLQYFLDLDGNEGIISILYYGALKNYRDCLYSYFSAFSAAQKAINNLLKLYGIERRVTVEFAEKEITAG